MTLHELFETRNNLAANLAELKKQITGIETKIQEALAADLEPFRVVKEFGTVKLRINGLEITHDVPKTVKWDQDQLQAIYSKIGETGDDPKVYIDTKYSVSETKFKTFPDPVKNVFLPARTVTPGKARITAKEAA